MIPSVRKAQQKRGHASSKTRKDWSQQHVLCINMETKTSLDEKAFKTFAGLQKFIFCGVVAVAWSSWRRCNAVVELTYRDLEVEPCPLSPTSWVFKTRFLADKEIQEGKPLFLCTAPTVESQPACSALMLAEHLIVMDAGLHRLFAASAPDTVSDPDFNPLLNAEFSAFVCCRQLFPTKVEVTSGVDVSCDFDNAVEYAQFKHFLEQSCIQFGLPMVQIHGGRGGGGTHARKVGLHSFDISARGNWDSYPNAMRYQQYSVADECKTAVWLASGREPQVAPPQEGLLPYKQVTKVLFDSPQVSQYGKVITAARLLFQDAYGQAAPSGPLMIDRIRAIVELHGKAKAVLSAGLATTSTFKIASWDEASLAACIQGCMEEAGTTPDDIVSAMKSYLSKPRVKPSTTGIMEQRKLSDFVTFAPPPAASSTPAPLMPDVATSSSTQRRIVVPPAPRDVVLAGIPTLKMVKFGEVRTLFEEGLSLPGHVRTPPLKDYKTSPLFKKENGVRTLMTKYNKIFNAMQEHHQSSGGSDWSATVQHFSQKYSSSLWKCYETLSKK